MELKAEDPELEVTVFLKRPDPTLVLRIYPWSWPDVGAKAARRAPSKADYDQLPNYIRDVTKGEKWMDKALFGRLRIDGGSGDGGRMVNNFWKSGDPTVSSLVKNVEGTKTSIGRELHKYYSSYKVREVKTKTHDFLDPEAETQRKVHSGGIGAWSTTKLKELDEIGYSTLEVTLYLSPKKKKALRVWRRQVPNPKAARESGKIKQGAPQRTATAADSAGKAPAKVAEHVPSPVGESE